MKLWNSMKQGAGKLAFEAERMVRIKKEETAIDEARKQIAAVETSLGQEALRLYRAGALDLPQVATLAKQVDDFDAVIKQHEDAIAGIRAEMAPVSEDGKPAEAPEYGPAQAPLAPMAPMPVERAEPVDPTPSEPAPEAPGRKCPNCGAAAPATGAFCPECGARLG